MFNSSHIPVVAAVGRFVLADFPLIPTVIVGGLTSSFTETVGAKVDTCDAVVDSLISDRRWWGQMPPCKTFIPSSL